MGPPPPGGAGDDRDAPGPDDYAAGRIAEAIERLRYDHRVVEADTPDELLDSLVADWYVDCLRHQAAPNIPPSSMVADHHSERRELNARARAILASQGVLQGPIVEARGLCFQRGDEVIAFQQDRDLRPDGADRDNFVHNGERGRVVDVHPGPHPALVVDFIRRGLVEVSQDHLTKPIRPGVVGQLAHSYAVTSHMAQGETYHAGRCAAVPGRRARLGRSGTWPPGPPVSRRPGRRAAQPEEHPDPRRGPCPAPKRGRSPVSGKKPTDPSGGRARPSPS